MNKIIAVLLLCFLSQVEAQQFSTARIWNKMVLNAIRNDFARPTVHARNLFHTSITMYDAYAAYDDTNETYFLGKTLGDYTCPFEGVSPVLDIQAAREKAISYAVFRLIIHRFMDAPGRDNIFHKIDLIFSAFGFDKSYTSTDYTNGNPAALGNYIAASLIEFGLQDGSNETNDYENQYYESINSELNPFLQWSGRANGEGNPRLVDPNRWQKLSISNFVGQAGNALSEVPDFIGPEWGNVLPFAMNEK